MTLTEILPTIRQLPVLDKIRLIRILAEELDIETNIFPFEPYKIYFQRSQTFIFEGLEIEGQQARQFRFVFP
jgi:hypothetical protein